MTKVDELRACLLEGWQSLPDLQFRFAWQEHTARAQIFKLGKKNNLTIERQRIDGITSYRIAPAVAKPAELGILEGHV